MKQSQQEDAVLLDTMLLIATAPVWLTWLIVMGAAGAWNDWRANP